MRNNKNKRSFLKIASALSFAVITTSTLASCGSGYSNVSNNSFAKGYIFDDNNNIKIKAADGLRDIPLNKETFVNALKELGATKEKPWTIIDKNLSITKASDDYQTFFNNKAAALSNLSDGLIRYNNVLRSAINPSVQEHYAQGNSTSGSFFWGRDYAAVGTFIESWFTDGRNAKNSQWIIERLIKIADNPEAYKTQYGEKFITVSASLARAIIESGLTSLQAPKASVPAGMATTDMTPAAMTPATMGAGAASSIRIVEGDAGGSTGGTGGNGGTGSGGDATSGGTGAADASSGSMSSGSSSTETTESMQPTTETSTSSDDMKYLELFKGKKFDTVVPTDPAKLQEYKDGIAKYIGEWTSGDSEHSLYIISFLDDQFSFIPSSSQDNTSISYSLIKNPQWMIRSNWKSAETLYRDSSGPEGEPYVLETTSKPTDGNELPLQSSFSSGGGSGVNYPGTYVHLISAETTGAINYDKATKTRSYNFDATYKLEGAKGLKLYDKDDKLLAVVLRPVTGDNASNWLTETETKAKQENSTAYVSKTGIVDPDKDKNLVDAYKKAVRYDWLIDKNIKWTDKTGMPVARLSARDFERGLEAFWLARQTNYTNNGYLIDQLGIDLQKTLNGTTVKTTENSIDKVTVTAGTTKITDSAYDIGKFTNDDDTYRVYIKNPYSFGIQFFSNSFNSPLPHWDSRVRKIRLNTQKTDSSNTTINSEFKMGSRWSDSVDGQIAVKSITENGKTSINIDKQGTKFDQLFGYINETGTADNLDYSLYSGSYYLDGYSANQYTFAYNDNYKKAFADGYYQNTKPVQKILYNYGGRTVDVIYSAYRNDNSTPTILLLPRSKVNDAFGKPQYSEFLWATRAADPVGQSSFLTWSANPSSDNPTYQDAVTKKIFKEWNSDNSRIVRAGIINLINWQKLINIVDQNTTFQVTSIPYRTFVDSKTFKDVQLNDGFIAARDNKFPEAFKVNGYSGVLRRPYTDFKPAGKKTS
ncbi:MG321/MPN456 family lipoprotein [Mycoplasma bradburyae]|uniref:MG321/MPN456 family lipoprotein n=1 Tax=Mycoplasma bradburyae TaxID=2963128 RepID=UPI0023410F92|nr:MG321/MPN456 family lipoprotein [Mycoplasma bradburyae]MDC4182801.1 hypothetical protein [Mycoplasma bradburyae]